MLAGLRLDGFVGGDNQQYQIDASNPSQHIAYEAFMAGYIDKTENLPISARQIRKAEFDGDPTRLFFLQPICVDPR